MRFSADPLFARERTCLPNLNCRWHHPLHRSAGRGNREPTVCFSKKYSLAGIPECRGRRYVGLCAGSVRARFPLIHVSKPGRRNGQVRGSGDGAGRSRSPHPNWRKFGYLIPARSLMQIERFNIRLRNEGYTSPGLRCVNGRFPAILGYAATCRVKSSNPPMTGNYYYDRTDWWSAIRSSTKTTYRCDRGYGFGPDWAHRSAEVHAAILRP